MPLDLATDQIIDRRPGRPPNTGRRQTTIPIATSSWSRKSSSWSTAGFAVFCTGQDDLDESGDRAYFQPVPVRADSVVLARFGLPEPTATHIHTDLPPSAGGSLHGLASRLLTDHWIRIAAKYGAATHRIPGASAITPEVAHRYQQPLPSGPLAPQPGLPSAQGEASRSP